MLIILNLKFKDRSSEIHYIPAEIWRLKHDRVAKVFVTKKELEKVFLDPFLETADVNTENNYFPPQQSINRFELFRQSQQKNAEENPMQRERRAKTKSSGTN